MPKYRNCKFTGPDDYEEEAREEAREKDEQQMEKQTNTASSSRQYPESCRTDFKCQEKHLHAMYLLSSVIFTYFLSRNSTSCLNLSVSYWKFISSSSFFLENKDDI